MHKAMFVGASATVFYGKRQIGISFFEIEDFKTYFITAGNRATRQQKYIPM